MYNPEPHHNMVSEYQGSSIPFVTSSQANEVSTTPIKVSFPYVTRWIEVTNTDLTAGDDLRVGFTQNGVKSAVTANYFVLKGGPIVGSTSRWEVKCTELWFLRHGAADTSFSVIAGLTNVKTKHFPVLTGSLPLGAQGVG